MLSAIGQQILRVVVLCILRLMLSAIGQQILRVECYVYVV